MTKPRVVLPDQKLADAAGLRRELGVVGAVMMGLGSIVGTGVFVSVAVAADAAGPSVVLALIVAAVVGLCNGLSSAQLAAAHPVSGGTYEYGYRWLNPLLGFSAGWMFLCAKTASAATAALGFAGYLLHAAGEAPATWRVVVAWSAVACLTLAALAGIRRSASTNVAIVGFALASLVFFIAAGLPSAIAAGAEPFVSFFRPASDDVSPAAGFFEACALSFVAYTGYGRIATLAEEVREPRRTIPLAIAATMVASTILYVAVAYIGVASVGAAAFGSGGGENVAPLSSVAETFPVPYAGEIVAAGAMAAMLSVLLNLILGLSRVVLAMGRRRDLPRILASVETSRGTPYAATIVVALLIATLVSFGDVKTTWSFSAFTVLVYYAITNLAALRLAPPDRRFPRFIPALGLASCLFLAFWVDASIWIAGLLLLTVGMAWHSIARRWIRDGVNSQDAAVGDPDHRSEGER